MSDLISREALKKELELSKYIIPTSINRLLNSEINRCIEAIDNAPTVVPDMQTFRKAINDCLNDVAKWNEKNGRPQGECKTCRHRDPEDKKCDCGGQERQGCIFPVSDDYFCKFYEKGGADDDNK